MTSLARPRRLQRTPPAVGAVALAILVAVSAATVLPGIGAAAQKGIAFELNKMRTIDGACHGTFVLRNDLGATLDRFQLDLYVFGVDGIIKLRSNIDLAPLRDGKATVFAFQIVPEPCAAVSRVLVNDIPKCRAQDGHSLDCLQGLSVASRARIKLEK